MELRHDIVMLAAVVVLMVVSFLLGSILMGVFEIWGSRRARSKDKPPAYLSGKGKGTYGVPPPSMGVFKSRRGPPEVTNIFKDE